MSGAPAAKKSLSAEPRASAAFQGIPCESCVYPGYSGVGGLLRHRHQKNAGNMQQNACGERLYGRKFPLSAILSCGFGGAIC